VSAAGVPAGFWSRVLHDVRGKQLRQRHRRHVKRGELHAYMGPVEWSQLTALLVGLAPRCLVEWGAGGGTRELLALGASIERYVSIEHDFSWFERLRATVVDPRLQLEHVAPNLPEPGGDRRDAAQRQRYQAWVERCEREPAAMRDYVERPARLVPAADLVFVDGRARCFCLREGYRLLRPGGVLVLHDAQRPEYNAALVELGAVFLEPWELGQLALVRKA